MTALKIMSKKKIKKLCDIKICRQQLFLYNKFTMVI